MTGAYGREMAERMVAQEMVQAELDRLGNDVDVDDDDFGYDFMGRQIWASSAPAVAGGARA